MPVNNTHLRIKTKALSSPRNRFILSCLNTGVARQEFKDSIMKKIPLTQGKFTLVDDEDFERLNKYKWYAHFSKGCFYVRRNLVRAKIGRKGKLTTMHRALMGAKSGEYIDHINGNGLDNRKSNLRVSKNLNGNCQNCGMRRNNTSGYKGVSLRTKSKKWVSQITAKDKRYILGDYDTAKEAAIAYDMAAKLLHGEYAKTNKDMGLL